MKKQWFWISCMAAILSISTAFAQQKNKQYAKYISRVAAFKQDVGHKLDLVDETNEVIAKNGQGQVLRFKSNAGVLSVYHCDVAFQLFDFEGGHLKKISTFDVNGKPKGVSEFFNVATYEFTVLRKDSVAKRFAEITAGDITARTGDEEEKNVLLKVYDDRNRFIRQDYISTLDYWDYQKMIFRP
ncbi:MAG: hypothetical protein J0I41_03750 [Filimonas sp.]|nr:hypothetical protein [Filimonas sp.]